ncbi:MAG: hypothetical protein RI885_219 [Actinomycetota bacterium]
MDRRSLDRREDATSVPPRRLADIGAEGTLIAGGGSAILLQLANPAIGHAVAKHSDFAAHPTRRLEHTLAFVYALVYGTPAQVAAVTRGVNRAHEPVVAASGEHPYRADDPDLQLWVAATLYDTAVRVHQRLLGPLTAAELDAIYLDYHVVGTALQVPPDAWPPNRSAFEPWWDERIRMLVVDDTARGVARELLYPSTGPLWLRAGMPLARLATAGLLPPRIRQAYGMPWGPRRERRFRIAMAGLAGVNRVLPRRVREWPRDHLLRRLR